MGILGVSDESFILFKDPLCRVLCHDFSTKFADYYLQVQAQEPERTLLSVSHLYFDIGNM